MTSTSSTSLTDEQEQSVTLFMEITATTDRSKAVQALTVSNWSVENAMNLHLSGGLEGL